MSVQRATQVVVVSNQGLVSETIGGALSARGFHVVVSPFPVGAGDVRQFRNLVAEDRPVVVLVISDLRSVVELREVCGVVRELADPALVVTPLVPGAEWGAVIDAGACGVLPMSTSIDDLDRALTALGRGRPVVPAEVTSGVLGEWRRSSTEARQLCALVTSLTPREFTILGNLSEGMSVKEITEEVGVTEGTVRSQVKSILRKLDVSSQLEGAAAYRRVSRLPPQARPFG